MSQLWYIYKNGQQEGPCSWGELIRQGSSGALTPSDLVWCEGMDSWCRADQIGGLFKNTSSGALRGKGLLIAAVIFMAVVLLGGGALVFNLLSPGDDEVALEGEDETGEYERGEDKIDEDESGEDESREDESGEDESENAATTSLSISEQQSLAIDLFNEIAEMDRWELEEMEPLYIQIMDEAPDTEIAEEGYWYLSNMYMQAFSPPRYDDAMVLLENYLERYPDSTYLDERHAQFAQHGFPVVENRLLRLYDEVGDSEKAAELYLELIPDPALTPDSQLDHLLSYGLSMEEVGRTEEAITAYQTYLERKEEPPSFMVEMAEERLQALE